MIPVLFAVFPLLSLFAQNETDIELAVLWWPLVFSVIAGLGAFGLALLAYRDAAKAAVLASVLVIAFFYYGAVAGWGPAGWWYVLLWAVISAVVVVALARTTRDVWSVTVVLAVAAVVLVRRSGDPHRQSTRFGIPCSRRPTRGSGRAHCPARRRRTARQLPDIYVLVPDDYPRPDVLRQYFHSHRTRPSSARFGAAASRSRRTSAAPTPTASRTSRPSSTWTTSTGLPKILGPKSQDVRPVQDA